MQVVQPPLAPQGVQWQVVQPPGVLMDTQTRPKQEKGAPARLITGIIQAILGLILLICGIVVISVHFPEPHYRSYAVSFLVEGIEWIDRQAWAIVVAVVLMINSILGILSKRNQVAISLYMAFSIFACVLTAVAIIPVSLSLAHSNQLVAAVKDGPLDILNDPCNLPQNYNFWSSEVPLLRQEAPCAEEMLSAARVHLAFHSISLICLVVEFVVAIVAASFTCVGLKCCRRTPNQHVVYYQAQLTPQFQNPSPFISQGGPPPPYPGQVVSIAAGQPLPPGYPPQQVVHSSVLQQAQPPDLYLPPDAIPSAPKPTDDQSYVEPNSAVRRPLPSPISQDEYAYTDTQYRPAPPPYENAASHPSNDQPKTDENYVVITG